MFTSISFAQRYDSILLEVKNDSVIYRKVTKADSITRMFQSKAESLNTEFQNLRTNVRSISLDLQSRIDSLNHLNLPVDRLTNKVDSLRRQMEDQVNSYTEKVDNLKSNVTHRLREINLPPPLQLPLQKLQASVDHYSLPSLQAASIELPKISIPDLDKWQLPSISKYGNIKELAGKAGIRDQDARIWLNTEVGDPGNMAKLMERKLAEMDGVGQIKEGTALLKQTERVDSSALVEKANDMVKELVSKEARNHFVGKEEVLQKAMSSMSTVKSKYEEVQSMAELPKRLPNPLHGKSLSERIIPGITFQIQKSGLFLLDINPMIMYRILLRFSVGVGWNQRLPIEGWSILKQERIYGPRAAFEVKWQKGIYFRFLPEIMNMTIPERMTQATGVDVAHRQWVGSLFFGIKKEYTVYRQMKGNTEVLYNLLESDGLSPYGDRFALRFGFDFPMKK